MMSHGGVLKIKPRQIPELRTTKRLTRKAPRFVVAEGSRRARARPPRKHSAIQSALPSGAERRGDKHAARCVSRPCPLRRSRQRQGHSRSTRRVLFVLVQQARSPRRRAPRRNASGNEATRQSAACSIAPAEARNIAGERGAEACSGHMIAVAPSATELRTIAPKFCGSMIPSNTTMMLVGSIGRSASERRRKSGAIATAP